MRGRCFAGRVLLDRHCQRERATDGTANAGGLDMEWISVDERLPEFAHPLTPHPRHSDWVILATSEGVVTKGMYHDCTHIGNKFDKWWVDFFGNVMIGVTHWMPLPPPPEHNLS